MDYFSYWFVIFFSPTFVKLISYFYSDVRWLSAATSINETVSHQSCFNTDWDLRNKNVHFQNQFQCSGWGYNPSEKTKSGKKTTLYLMNTEKCVYYVALNQKRGVFFRIVQRRSCVLRASAGQEAQLHGPESTYNWQHLNHQQLSDPMLQYETHTHTEPFSSANEAFERGWRA